MLKEYEGKVRVVFKHLVVHPQQVAKTHLAACAAGKQGKFKEFYRAFWHHGYKAYQEKRDPSLLGEENTYAIAAGVGLDVERLKADMPGCQAVIEADENELRKFRVNATPGFFINGEFVGGFPQSGLKPYVEQKLKVAQASGVPGSEYYDKEIFGKGEKSVQ